MQPQQNLTSAAAQQRVARAPGRCSDGSPPCPRLMRLLASLVNSSFILPPLGGEALIVPEWRHWQTVLVEVRRIYLTIYNTNTHIAPLLAPPIPLGLAMFIKERPQETLSTSTCRLRCVAVGEERNSWTRGSRGRSFWLHCSWLSRQCPPEN